jgi:subtilisin family serine protease
VVWYPDSLATVDGAILLPDETAFVSASGTFRDRGYEITNRPEVSVLRDGLGVVVRDVFEFVINPYRNRHVLGRYVLRLTASGQVTAHLWCRHTSSEGMRLVEAEAPIETNVEVHVEDESTIGEYGGAANVTVTAYTAELATPAMAGLSSRGPLISWTAGPAPPAKPDIAAPGASVDAARSRSAPPWKPTQTTPMTGTSMAAPHVAGTIALLLQANPALTVAEIVGILRSSARTTPSFTINEAGAGMLDAKAAVDRVP